MAGLLLQLLVLLGLPALVALVSAHLSWGVLSRPWLYLLASSIALYAVYVVAFVLFAPRAGGYLLSMSQPHAGSTEEPVLLLLQPYAKPLLMFAVTALPTVLILLRLFRKASNP